MSPIDLDRLSEIVNFAKNIQKEYSITLMLSNKKRKLEKELIEICRKCEDNNCHSNGSCEVKKAYNLLQKIQ